ncbi:MAG: hypothetical protein WCB27_18160 [Thermoguttaceae bacterium]
MTPSVLLIFATRYDDVTRRTYGIAQRLLADAKQASVVTVTLFDADATCDGFLQAATQNRPIVIAFYSHGNDEGAILTQDREPCWSSRTVPDFSGIALFAHTCRGIRWLRDQASRHKARLLVGYENDLLTPRNGSPRFWNIYEELHSFVPQQLATKADGAQVRRQFYDLCTKRFYELNSDQTPLMEMVAIMQSRDWIVFVG